MTEAGEASGVRQAAPADAAGLAILDSLVNPSPWSATQFAAACNGSPESAEHALVVEGEGQLLGFVIFSRVLDEACIHNIAVLPSRQGAGLGALLLESALARAAAAGATRCYLEVRASNLAARGLYQKFAFVPDGVRRGYYPAAAGREDALLMSRQLAETG